MELFRLSFLGLVVLVVLAGLLFGLTLPVWAFIVPAISDQSLSWWQWLLGFGVTCFISYASYDVIRSRFPFLIEILRDLVPTKKASA